jgi:hypothetical protein
MAYRVTSDSVSRARKGAPRPSGDRSLNRNAATAGLALALVAFAAAGMALFGHGRTIDAAGPKTLRIALVDPVAPKVVRRDPRAPIATPGPHLAAVPATRPAIAPPIPLPLPRPQRVAAVPLPPAPATDVETTGSLGQEAHGAVVASANPVPAPPPKPRHKLTPFEKLYGPVRLASLEPSGAASDAGLLRAPYDRHTAVYVIADKKVYLPDGRALEAHSGYGAKMDDPRFVNVRMRGATPPHVYDLALRESLFHGVEAIRLNPVGGNDDIFGRTGLLAHTYMLGPRGDSNGCVSFRNYAAFLRAYKAGEISRLAVIARLD